MELSLFTGELVRLAGFNPEQDAADFSRWSHDPEYMRLLDADPIRPLTAGQIKKKVEAMEKEEKEGKSRFRFTIRTLAEDRLVGFTSLQWIEWTHGAGWLQIGIGDRTDRGQGFGGDALRLILHYAFAELNLYRLAARTFEYNAGAIRFLQAAGFQEEVRQRQAIQRDGRRWDLIDMGILQTEWAAARAGGERDE